MTKAEWQKLWWAAHKTYVREGKAYNAFEMAHRHMLKNYGPEPDGPPSLKWIAFRLFWLTKVKKMDWKKLGLGSLAAIMGAVAGAIPAAAEGGISGNEWYGIGAVALGALALFLKDPNAHKGHDVRQVPGVRNLLKK